MKNFSDESGASEKSFEEERRKVPDGASALKSEIQDAEVDDEDEDDDDAEEESDDSDSDSDDSDSGTIFYVF